MGGMRPVRGCLILLGCFGYSTSRTPGLHSRVRELVQSSCALWETTSTSGPETERLGTALVISTPSFAKELMDKKDESFSVDGAVMLPPAALEVSMTPPKRFIFSFACVFVYVCVGVGGWIK